LKSEVSESAGSVRLAVDLSSSGTARLALAQSGRKDGLGPIATYDGSRFSTLTEVFQTFERDQGVALQNTHVAIAIAGIASGNSIPIVRSRWTLSHSGLSSYFGRPVTILNEVAAKAWAAMGAAPGSIQPIIGQSQPVTDKSGRWAFVSLADGLGVAAIDVDMQGHIRVIETEAGHMRFSPFDTPTDAVLAQLRRIGGVPTWEAALLFTRGANSVSDSLPGGSRDAHSTLHARILGAFTADTVLALGAWDGVIMADQAGRFLLDRAALTAFSEQFQFRRAYTRLLQQLPVWVSNQADVALRGCANLLARV
jgi:glucokinase